MASCGGSTPVGPSGTGGPANPPVFSALPSGPYLLSVSMATSGSGGFSTCVSITIGGATPTPVTAPVSASVHVVHDGSIVIVTPDDPTATFRMDLQVSGLALAGTAAGQYQGSGTTMTVGGGAGSAAATGTFGPSTVSGTLDGTVTAGGTSCTNNGHTWVLSPQ